MSHWPVAARRRKVLNDAILAQAVGRHYGLGKLLEDHGLVKVLELLEDHGLVKVLAADGGNSPLLAAALLSVRRGAAGRLAAGPPVT